MPGPPSESKGQAPNNPAWALLHSTPPRPKPQAPRGLTAPGRHQDMKLDIRIPTTASPWCSNTWVICLCASWSETSGILDIFWRIMEPYCIYSCWYPLDMPAGLYLYSNLRITTKLAHSSQNLRDPRMVDLKP